MSLRAVFAERLAPVELPYPRAASTTDAVPVVLELAAAGAAPSGPVTAGFVAWISRVTGAGSVSLAYTDEALLTAYGGVEPWSVAVPLTVKVAGEPSAGAVIDAVAGSVAALRLAGSGRDLPFQTAADDSVREALNALPIGIDLCAPSGTGNDRCELVLSVDPASGRPVLIFPRGAFSADVCRTIARHVDFFLAQFLSDRDRRLDDIQLVPPEEQTVIDRSNRTATPISDATSITGEIVRQMRRTPGREAIRWGAQTLDYAALEARAATIAARLEASGARAGTIVGIHLERTPDLVATVLAILSIGAAYLPLDPAYPAERLRYMVEDSAAPIVVTQRHLASLAREGTVLVTLGSVETPVAPQRARLDRAAASPEHLAYVIYTSGSTGKPKGVMLTHRNVLNFFAGMDSGIPHGDGGRWLAVTSLSFDISVLELLWTLARGFTIVLHSNASAAGPMQRVSVADDIAAHRATYLQCTPSMASMLVADPAGRAALARLDLMMVGGEALSLPLARELRALVPRKLLNAYGPTETTVWSSLCDIADVGSFVPLGAPIANTTIHILDAAGRECPALVAGELYIGGAGLARGYLNRPELTAQRFVPNPFDDGLSDRLYRTGDLVRRQPDGTLEFIGRIDNQVKIRGHRIELGEIESVLAREPLVKDAVVHAHRDEAGEQHLLGYVTPRGAASLDGRTLRRRLAAVLPEFMVPARVIVLPAMPLTPNGKIDRARLPKTQPATEAPAVREDSELETRIAGYWRELLGIDRVEADDEFADLGGSSVMAVRLFARIRTELGVDLPLASLYEARSLRQLAELVAGKRGGRPGSVGSPARAPAAAKPEPPLAPIDEPSDWNPLVTINRGAGARPKFFCVHGGGGNVLIFGDLAKALGRDQPFYGLQALGVDGRNRPHTTVEAMAAAYLGAIRRVQPTGPYFLGGYSGGGVIAHEMARRLVDAGEAVSLLVLFDTVSPVLANFGPPQGRRWSAEYLLHRPARSVVRRVKRLFGVETVLPDEVAGEEYQRQIPLIREHLARGEVMPEELRGVHLYDAYMAAQRHYRPTPLPVPILLFRATEQDRRFMGERYLGWERLSTRPIEVRRVRSDHIGLMAGHNVARMSAILRGRLDRVAPPGGKTASVLAAFA